MSNLKIQSDKFSKLKHDIRNTLEGSRDMILLCIEEIQNDNKDNALKMLDDLNKELNIHKKKLFELINSISNSI